MNMGKKLTIVLQSLDLGQLVEGLQAREEAWRKTADFMESGYTADDSFVCEECTDADEATRIADYYGRIIRSIEEQVSRQGGWWHCKRTIAVEPLCARHQRRYDCTEREAELLEVIMLHHILHSTALDWVRADEFHAAALQAMAILEDFRAMGDTRKFGSNFSRAKTSCCSGHVCGDIRPTF
jgi:hypothetical protein